MRENLPELFKYTQAHTVMLKILQARLQQYVNHELPNVQAGFRKGRGTRDPIANIHWIIEKSGEFHKNIFFCFIDYAKAFDCEDHNKLWKILNKWDYQTTLPASWEICMQVKKQVRSGHGTTDWFQVRKGVHQAVYCHPAYLTYKQSTSWETLDWKKHKLQSRYQPQICIWYHPYGIKWRRTKEPLNEGESGVWKSLLKAQHAGN